MSEATFLSKLLLKSSDSSDTKCHIYLQTKWLENSVELVATETRSHKSYKGNISIDEMRESAADINMYINIPFETFYDECRSAMTTNIGALPLFEYEIDSSCFKLFKKLDFMVQYLEIEMREVQHNTELLETAITLIEASQKQKANVAEQANIADQQEMVKAFEKCVAEKEGLETKMLKKFAVILNGKKEKIAELEEKLLEHMRNTPDATLEDNEEPEVSNSRKTKPRKIQSDSEEEDYALDTQPMTPPSTSSVVKRRRGTNENT